MTRHSHPPSVVRNDQGLAVVQRPRLLDALDEAVQRRVTMLIAPVGYGKRTLLDQWVARRGDRVVRLDGRDLDPQTLRGVRGGRPGSPQVVVIEHADHATADVLDEALGLLEHEVRLVVVGTTRPAITIGALISRGEVTELGMRDLALTRDEVHLLLATAGPVRETALDVVMETTRGWAAPLRVLSEDELSWERESSQTARLRGFLDEEVFSLATPDELELLRDLSVLPEVSRAAAQGMTGDPEAHLTLADLVARGLPAVLTGTKVRLHPIVRRHLREELAETDLQRHRRLAGEGVQWLAEHGETMSALELALESGAPAEAAALLRRHFVQFLYTRPGALRRVVERCAEARHIPAWEAALLQSALLAATQEVSVELALPALDALVPGDLEPVDRIRAAGFRLFIARSCAYRSADLDRDLATADETLALGHPQRDLLPHLAFLQVERGLHLLYTSDLGAANTWLVRGLTTARLTDLRPVAVQALAGRAFITARRGGVAAARRIADEALMEFTALGPEVAEGPLAELAWLAHATVDIDLGDVEQGAQHLSRFRSCGAAPRRETAAIAAHLEAMADLMRGDATDAVARLTRFRAELGPLLPFEDYMLSMTECGALVFADVDRARADQLVDRCEQLHRPEYGVVAYMRAHLLMRLDRFDEAYALLEPLVRSGDVVIEKEWLQMLMAFAMAADRTGHTGVAVATFSAADDLATRLGLDAAPARHNLGTVERRAKVPFTEAERHLIRNLSADESIKELADRLFISPNTVKTHLRRIYRKLDVTSRDEAIERARVMRIM